MIKIKIFCLSALLSFCVLAQGFSEAVMTFETGHQNYIDSANSRMIQGVFGSVSGSAVFFKNLTTGLFLNGTFAVTEPNYILCSPGLQIGGLIPYDTVFQTFTVHFAPVFHSTDYLTPDIDIAAGAKFRNYLKAGKKNLFVVFTFGVDYYINVDNMAYTITAGLGRKAFFNNEPELAQFEIDNTTAPIPQTSTQPAETPQIPRLNPSNSGNNDKAGR